MKAQRDELQAENTDLRARVTELEGAAAALGMRELEGLGLTRQLMSKELELEGLRERLAVIWEEAGPSLPW